ncbi:Helix-loop-helix DNA-binding domain [Geosmithia morbida]|uniref:Helix-loop-helix DNA-binding domain n=1 Tax=Geosmithia morbida TaxID=1094350 RepID=A0A9P4YVD0_9HYPO|nr:Helix-loop-helix DNA-binding domain [Geosmithia morbida]KAF4122484.1 Helix-loop-helix DNA-binding domain [Geosmithia morbida]
MPRSSLPPTPGSSADTKVQDGTQDLASLHMTFELPPPAYQNPPAPGASSASPYPLQAAETVKSRRRSSTMAGESSFSLPPPPTRSRKIVQMKPRQQNVSEPLSPTTPATPAKGKGGTGKGAAGSGAGSVSKVSTAAAALAAQGQAVDNQQGKKKQPSSTSAAGRKIARKTAHSLIERRRRNKMNEEFALLKSMIPACTGEMHKLAILQASIEYVRYLEDCVTQLKDQHESVNGRAQLPSIREFHPTFRDDDETVADADMDDSEAVSPTFTAQSNRKTLARHPSTSPALHAMGAHGRQNSYSSASTDHQRHYSYSAASAGPSPALGPQFGASPYPVSNAGSALTSPALNPQPDMDQEATVALLMLNTDRRGFNPADTRRTVSVRDLLTS